MDKTVKRSHKFFVHRVTGQEALCNDFSYRIHISTLERLSPNEIENLPGTRTTLHIAFNDQNGQVGCRYVNGIIYDIKELGLSRAPHVPNIWRYEIEIGSWLRDLERVTDCRIFQQSGKSSVKIAMALLEEMGCRDIRNKTTAVYPRKDYVVMYNESVLNFVKRLLLDSRVIWYFEHSESRHTLVLIDDSMKLPAVPDSQWGRTEGVTSFFRETGHTPLNNWWVAAYDWENPPVKQVRRKLGGSLSSLDHFQFPGRFLRRSDVEQEAEQSKITVKSNKTCYHGESTVKLFSAGTRFKLSASMLPDLHDQPFIIQSLRMEASDKAFSNTFEAYLAKEPYLPALPKDIKKPVIIGSQTAVVVGEAGMGKVSTDKMGRVKVRFHWDHRSSTSSSHTSAYVRVAGPCAGSQRGFLFTPRIGEEVMVSFENGDPDKPMITGSVYSKQHKPPQPANLKPYQSIIKTGSEPDANAIVFNDSPGAETLDIRAKKDLTILVGRDLDIEVKDTINIEATSIDLVIRNDIKVDAGGSIINLTANAIHNTAGANISTMALGGVFNMAGGLLTNLAGCTETNTAIFSVENTSSANIKGNAETLLANTALNAVANTGPKVENDAKLAMTNVSQGILNDSKDVQTDTLFRKVKVKENSVTEAGKFNIKGLMTKIN